MKKIATTYLKCVMLGVILSSMFVGEILTLSPNPPAELYTKENLSNIPPHISGNHAPIKIDGNADFATQSTENGWTGDGSVGNPYVIQNLVILTDVDDQSAIFINNTDVFFIIQNCTISSTGENTIDQNYPSGIQLQSVSNAKISNNTAENCNFNSFSLQNSNNNTLTDNTAPNTHYGFYLEDSNNNTLTNNLVQNSRARGFTLLESSNNILKGNIIRNNILDEMILLNAHTGILIRQSSHNNTLINNTVYRYVFGFALEESNNNIIAYNTARNNTNGFVLINSDSNTISYNFAQDNEEWGFYLEGFSNEIKFNNFVSAKGGEVLAYCNDSTNIFDYNYWSNHTSPDADGDGIVDVPYAVEGGACVDSHPVTKMYIFLEEEEKNEIPGYSLGAILLGALSLITLIKRKIALRLKK